MSPDFAVFNDMDDNTHHVEVLSAGVKHRWENSRLDDNDNLDMEDKEDLRIAKDMELVEAKARQLFDPTSKELNLDKPQNTTPGWSLLNICLLSRRPWWA